MAGTQRVIGVDSNVLIRFLVDDDPDQNRAARLVLSSCDVENPVFVSAVTLAETVWLLTNRLKYPMKEVARLLLDLLASEGLVIEHAGELDLLVGDDRAPSTDLADYLIAWSGASAGCRHTLTFDRQAAKVIPAMELLA